MFLLNIFTCQLYFITRLIHSIYIRCPLALGLLAHRSFTYTVHTQQLGYTHNNWGTHTTTGVHTQQLYTTMV